LREEAQATVTTQGLIAGESTYKRKPLRGECRVIPV
jgi:hypothetical protein